MEKKNIGEKFEMSLAGSEMENIGMDFSEVALDSVLKEGAIREIPIVRTLVGLTKIGLDIHQTLFVKKILAFMRPLSAISRIKREKMIKKINKSQKSKIAVGEKLLYIIESCEDYEISAMVGELFCFFLSEKISYDDFLKTVSVLKSLSKPDVIWFTTVGEKQFEQLDQVSEYVGTGLFQLFNDKIDVEISGAGLGESPRGQADGAVGVKLTRPAEILRQVFYKDNQRHSK